MRRLPVYLLLDTSGSMMGEPIEAVKNGVDTLVSSLRQDPYALETAHLSIISFDTHAKQISRCGRQTYRQPVSYWGRWNARFDTRNGNGWKDHHQTHQIT